MTETQPVVLIVDDDPSARAAIGRLVRSAGCSVESFVAARDLLARGRPDKPCCLILDVKLPDWSGLDVQRALADAGVRVPIIFITGYGDIPMSVRAMKAGAVDFLSKPFDEQEILDAVARAIEVDAHLLQATKRSEELHRCYATLTEREREVFGLVASGMPNKQVGQQLGVTEKTVKVHRARVMSKMNAASLAELVRIADMVGICRELPLPVHLARMPREVSSSEY